MDEMRAFLRGCRSSPGAAGLELFADAFEREGYDDLNTLLGSTEEDIADLVAAVGMRPGH